jgi:hypothetical protein
MSNVRKCSTICRKLIHSEDSELIIAPISDKKYIRNDKLGIFVTMDGGQVTVTNHTYSYFIKLGDAEWIKLKDFFKKEMELRAMQMEKEMEYQIKHSLDTIYTKISTELVTQK